MPGSGVRPLRLLRWFLPFLAAFLPIVLLSVYSLRIAEESVSRLVSVQTLSAASSFSRQTSAEMLKRFDVANAIASLPGTVAAVRASDVRALRERLRPVVLAYPDLTRAFVTTSGGQLWSDYPPGIDTIGTELASSSWYRELLAHQGTFASSAYLGGSDASPQLLSAIVARIQDDDGRTLGFLVLEYQLRAISKRLQSTEIGISGLLFLLDQRGMLIAHPDDSFAHRTIDAYAHLPAVQEALGGTLFTTEYVDPLLQKHMLATFLPFSVGKDLWVAVAAQPQEEAYAPLRAIRSRIALGGIVLTLVTGIIVIALARSRAKIERLEQMKDNFIAFVSHQLRTPVNAIAWYLEILLEEESVKKLPTKYFLLLKEMEGINRSDQHLINDLLNVSRINRGVIKVETAPVPLKDIVEAAVRNYRQQVADKGLLLRLEGMDAGITVEADLEKTAEAIGNSISNAIKYTSKGSITVALRTDDRSGIVDVRDTGEGIEPDTLQKLFTRDQVLGSSAQSTQSAGLGLYIAKQFMRLQGSDVTVTSQVGKGTTFTYALPLAEGLKRRKRMKGRKGMS